jgi:hypothetical protein
MVLGTKMNYKNIFEAVHLKNRRPKIGQIIKYYLDGSKDAQVDFVFEVYEGAYDEVRTISDGMQSVEQILDDKQDPMFIGLAQIYKDATSKDRDRAYKELSSYMDSKLAQYKEI